MEKSAYTRSVFALGIICVLLTGFLLGATAYYFTIIDQKDRLINDNMSAINSLNLQIEDKDDTISSQALKISAQDTQTKELSSSNKQLQMWLEGNITLLNSQIAALQDQAASDKSTIFDLQNQVAFANSQVSSLNSTLTSLQSQTAQDKSTIAGLQDQITAGNSLISALNSTVGTLQNRVDYLTSLISTSNSNSQTLVFHVCEKGQGYSWGHIPNVNDTYSQILALNNDTYDVLLLPEYKGNSNWTETFNWLKENFTEVPIMLSVFEGGPNDYPVQQLSTEQISEAMEACDVRSIRLFEVVSWHIEHNVTFPAGYIANILTFCKENNLTVFWSEWKVGHNVFQNLAGYIAGYEDIVTVSFSTNSGELEPAEGFIYISQMFQHWGGSVQAWYWETRHRDNSSIPEDPEGFSDPLNMPISLLVEHALIARNMDAEIIQFEPYWYFFDNGEANENLKLLLDTIV